MDHEKSNRSELNRREKRALVGLIVIIVAVVVWAAIATFGGLPVHVFWISLGVVLFVILLVYYLTVGRYKDNTQKSTDTDIVAK